MPGRLIYFSKKQLVIFSIAFFLALIAIPALTGSFVKRSFAQGVVNIESLKSTVDKLKAELDALQQPKTELENKIAPARSEIDRLSSENTRLSQELAREQDPNSGRYIGYADPVKTEQIKANNARISELNSIISQAQSELDKLLAGPSGFNEVQRKYNNANAAYLQNFACFTPWSYRGESGGGIAAWQCDNYFSEQKSRNSPFSTKIYIDYQNSPCSFYIATRSQIVCPPLDSVMKLSADRTEIPEFDEFTLSWQLANAEGNPRTKCALSGKAPNNEPLPGETIQGSKTYVAVPRGIYNFSFTCTGILNNAKSTAVGSISKSLKVSAGDIPPAPKVSIKVEPAAIKKGESAVLSWTSENAIAVSISQNLGVVGKSGSLKVSPSATTRYAITGSGEFAELGLARASVSLRVVAPDAVKIDTAPDIIAPEDVSVEIKPEAKPEVGLTVNGQKGMITTGVPANLSISWKADQYCIAYGSWLGIKNKAGTESRNLAKAGNYSYKLYCPGIGTEEVSVKAVIAGGGAGAVSLPVAEAGVSLDGKNFSRSVRVIKGAKTHLWLGAANDVTGDRRASRDSAGGWSSVMSAGGRCDWNYDLNRGIPVFDVGIADPKTAKDCLVDLGEVAFYDEPGVYTYGVLRLVQADGKVSNVSSINIAVTPPPPPDTPPVIDFRANGKENEIILGAPAEYDLVWDVKNADTCTASGSWTGGKPLSGMQKFVSSQKRELNHTLTCVGKLGTTAKNIFVKVAELPVCDFSALPLVLDKKSVFDRQSALTWKCQFANSCVISPSTGAGVGTFGTVRVSPIQTTTYTLTCQNLEGSSSFDQLVEVR